MFCLCLNVSVRKVCVLCTLSINRFILDPICDVALLNSGWLVYCWFHDFGLLLSLRCRFYVCSICYSLNHYTHVHITGSTNQMIQHSRGKTSITPISTNDPLSFLFWIGLVRFVILLLLKDDSRLTFWERYMVDDKQCAYI